MSFAQRMGLKSVRSIIQKDGMDNDLRNGLWNATLEYCTMEKLGPEGFAALLRALWRDYFKWTADNISLITSWKEVRKWYFECYWYEVYDFIEFLAGWLPNGRVRRDFINECDAILKRELSAYRFVGDVIAPLTSEEEIAAIEEALHIKMDTVAMHLTTALAHLSDKQDPDYRNSIKEAISAVETVAKKIDPTGNKTLGPALDWVGKHTVLHQDLKDGFKKLYGYTNDANGIRHALMSAPSLDQEDAKFMLVACSAFVNYLVAKAAKARLPL